MPAALEPFHTISIGNLAFKLASEGRSVIHMEYGMPSAQPPMSAQNAAKAMIDEGVPGYWESPALQEQIAARYKTLYGLTIDPSRIFLTCGASPALVLALSVLFNPGDSIAIARPGYVAYRNTMRGLNLTPLELECGPDSRYQLTANILKQRAMHAQGVLISSPANPTGSIVAPDELERIAAHCQETGKPIISDEIYHQLSYDVPTRSMLEYAPGAVVVNSFSKYFCMPGWRLGWLVAPPHLCDAVTAYMGNFFLTAPSIAQAAGHAALGETDELDGHLETYRHNRALLLKVLPELGLTRIAPPDGAFYIYADISHLTDDSKAFCFELLEDTGVATAPGVDFDPVNGHHFMRLSFAVTPDEIEEAIARLRPWFANRKPQR
ncbi:MAG: aminotransferase class I/II-fold pyridoxal phosphate-dependent enzyme [Pseudomonadota bacterium]